MMHSEMVSNVTVDTDILDFLKFAYFGDTANKVKAASRRAYLDMNRTIPFNDFPKEGRYQLRMSVQQLFEKEIPTLLGTSIQKQSDFDGWHFQVCQDIISLYRQEQILFTIGQAQKWLNMTIKYLYTLEYDTFDQTFPFFHLPLDRYIFESVRTELGIKPPCTAWSRLDDYQTYLAYQGQIREKLVGISPLRWEFRFWLKAVKAR